MQVDCSIVGEVAMGLWDHHLVELYQSIYGILARYRRHNIPILYIHMYMYIYMYTCTCIYTCTMCLCINYFCMTTGSPGRGGEGESRCQQRNT